MKKKVPIIELSFKNCIGEKIYLFDLFAKESYENRLTYVGKVEVNMQNFECIIHSNKEIDISRFYKKIAEAAVSEAIDKKRIIELLHL